MYSVFLRFAKCKPILWLDAHGFFYLRGFRVLRENRIPLLREWINFDDPAAYL